MANTISQNVEGRDEHYISLSQAARLCEYSQDYLSLRARQKKLKAVKLGRNWVTTAEWLSEYIAQAKAYKAKIKKQQIVKKQKAVAKATTRLQVRAVAAPPVNLPIVENVEALFQQPVVVEEGIPRVVARPVVVVPQLLSPFRQVALTLAVMTFFVVSTLYASTTDALFTRLAAHSNHALGAVHHTTSQAWAGASYGIGQSAPTFRAAMIQLDNLVGGLVQRTRFNARSIAHNVVVANEGLNAITAVTRDTFVEGATSSRASHNLPRAIQEGTALARGFFNTGIRDSGKVLTVFIQDEPRRIVNTVADTGDLFVEYGSFVKDTIEREIVRTSVAMQQMPHRAHTRVANTMPKIDTDTVNRIATSVASDLTYIGRTAMRDIRDALLSLETNLATLTSFFVAPYSVEQPTEYADRRIVVQEVQRLQPTRHFTRIAERSAHTVIELPRTIAQDGVALIQRVATEQLNGLSRVTGGVVSRLADTLYRGADMFDGARQEVRGIVTQPTQQFAAYVEAVSDAIGHTISDVTSPLASFSLNLENQNEAPVAASVHEAVLYETSQLATTVTSNTDNALRRAVDASLARLVIDMQLPEDSRVARELPDVQLTLPTIEVPQIDIASDSRHLVATAADTLGDILNTVFDDIAFTFESFTHGLRSVALAIGEFFDIKDDTTTRVAERAKAPELEERPAVLPEARKGLVVIPSTPDDEAARERIKRSFSDEVVIKPKDDDSGIIMPVFKEKTGEDYLYVLVPVNEE